MTAPILLALFGRGNVGKTTLMRILVDRAMEAGRLDFTIADGDRTNGTLAEFYSGVVRPPETDDQSVLDWLDDLINAQVDARTSLLLDMGGGDTLFPRFASEVGLVELLKEAGIASVAVHVAGPDPDDLAVLREMQASKVFVPTQTIVVFNAGRDTTGRAPVSLFHRVMSDKTYLKVVKEGARTLHLPRMHCMDAVNAGRLTFTAAASKLRVTDRQRLAVWRRQIEGNLSELQDALP